MDEQPDKKSRILAATLKLITDHGFHGTPVSMIAQEANVGAGTIYRYFESKEAIINELYDRLQKDLHEATLQNLPQQLSVRDEFYLKWRNILRYFHDHPYEAKFLEQFSASPFINPALMEENSRRNAHLGVLRTRGIATGQIRDVDYHTLVILMWGTVHQLHHLETAGTLQVTEALIDDIFRVVWDGIRVHPEA